jgi:hypothetical protein
MENEKLIRIKVEQLFEAKVLGIIENDIKNGISYVIEFDDGSDVVIRDLDSLKSFLKDRNIK